MNRPETCTLTVRSQRYERWEEIKVTREIDRMCTDFNIAVSERYLGSASIFLLAPLQECTVAIGSDPALTGYTTTICPRLRRIHAARITGRSKTEDIVDCTPATEGPAVRRLQAGRDRARSPACSTSTSLCKPMSASHSGMSRSLLKLSWRRCPP
ncbi:MAG TPA: hypothetical protein VKI44_11850 [Acetobacteraceae bacterium]|nr:hypothetical protein [Acetobacteraceae bacterium]